MVPSTVWTKTRRDDPRADSVFEFECAGQCAGQFGPKLLTKAQKLAKYSSYMYFGTITVIKNNHTV